MSNDIPLKDVPSSFFRKEETLAFIFRNLLFFSSFSLLLCPMGHGKAVTAMSTQKSGK
jgi:hypothetical protein